MNNFDFNIWENSTKKSFVFINKRSNIKNDWLDYDEILKTDINGNVITGATFYNLSNTSHTHIYNDIVDLSAFTDSRYLNLSGGTI